MKLSVLITTYNLEKYIDETLQSVMNQETNFEFEVLVGDDGSSDHTVERIQAWEENYPNKIHHFVMSRDLHKTYNRIERASKNRINLLSHANGEYLIFLDGDDVYIDKQKLQKQVDILDCEKNQDCIACAHDIYLYWSEEKKERINGYTKQFKIEGERYWRDCMYFHSDTVMFRNVFHKSFPREIRQEYYDDNIIVYYLLKFGKIIYLPETMVNYRQIENSSWNSVNEYDKNIINLMDKDIELQINPGLKKQSEIRHIYNTFFLWKNRMRIPTDMIEKYMPQIEKDQLWESRFWLSYREQPIGKKLKMNIIFLKNMFYFVGIKIGKEIRKNEYK